MKSINFLILVFALAASGAVHSYEINKKVVARDKKFKAKIMTRTLVDLESEDSFDGKYFKIVFKKEKEAIKFTEHDKEVQLRAATTYYHLNKARAYFVNIANSKYVKSLPKLTIRINITNKYSELGHFTHDNLEPQFNNALSIPAGVGYPDREIEGWNNEIWFRPSKRVHVSSFAGSGASTGNNEMKYILRKFRNETHMVSFQKFLASLVLGQAFFAGENPASAFMRVAGTSIMIEGIYRTTTIAASLFSRKWYYLDSALVPEIIYHEFAHIALSDELSITHSSPVNEGMADYFAGKIANSKILGEKIKRYNVFSGKKVKKKQMYKHQFEEQGLANADFVFGLLYETEKIVGKENGVKMLYSMRKKIETESTIRDQLLEGILGSCKEFCKNPNLDYVRLLKLFHYKGI